MFWKLLIFKYSILVLLFFAFVGGIVGIYWQATSQFGERLHSGNVLFCLFGVLAGGYALARHLRRPGQISNQTDSMFVHLFPLVSFPIAVLGLGALLHWMQAPLFVDGCANATSQHYMWAMLDFLAKGMLLDFMESFRLSLSLCDYKDDFVSSSLVFIFRTLLPIYLLVALFRGLSYLSFSRWIKMPSWLSLRDTRLFPYE